MIYQGSSSLVYYENYNSMAARIFRAKRCPKSLSADVYSYNLQLATVCRIYYSDVTKAIIKYHVNKLQEKVEEPIEQEQIIASDRPEVAAKWSRFIFWVGGLSKQAGKQSQLPSIPRSKHKQRSAVDVGDNKSRCREWQTIGLRNM